MIPRFALLTLLLVGCRSLSRPLEDVVPPGTAEFALDPYPTPRTAELTDRVVRFDPEAIDVAALDGSTGDAFTIDVSEEGRVRIRATDKAATAWARLALDQMTSDGWVRVGRVRDGPAFPLRGSKRLREWELAYRANLAYEKPFPGVVNVAVHSPGGVLDATETGVDRAAAFFRSHHSRGVRRFAIEFDDVGFGLTRSSRELFGTYPRAISAFLTACRDRLRTIDADAVLYWLPQTYWTNEPRLTIYASDIGTAGGLPKDLGLVLTGPDVISETIEARDIGVALLAFGLRQTKTLIYDNRGREGDHGPLAGRGPDLLKVADAVFGERGEVLNRLTRLDYAWNPTAYDPARSHLLACREIVGPAAAPALSRLIRDGAGLGADARRKLHSEVMEKLRSPSRSPVDATEYLSRVWQHVGDRAEQ